MLKDLATNEGLENDKLDELITYCSDYKQRKAQKAQIKKELMPIAWHPH